ncbi:MAG: thymidine phosphorylase [Candidatus Saganbacteria bacterium]|nr:thymidine phosphorylase [Candidatus Saganbacteria bacterium]
MDAAAARPITVGEVLRAVRDKQPLTPAQMRFFVRGVVEHTRKDIAPADRAIDVSQLAAWLMAVRIQGLTPDNTVLLTKTMAEEGDQLDLSGVNGEKIDKHSTGGVGDFVSPTLAALVSTFTTPEGRPIVIPMMSGRGLGHTGGTLDALEAIPGFCVSLTQSQIVTQLNRTGLAIFGQTGAIAPADKILYALRNITETIDSIPLIAASIMSKKLVEGADSFVMNVTTGSGAFMKELNDAVVLARTMVDIAKAEGRKVSSVVSSMDQPLSPMIGNALAVKQVLRVLSGETRGFERYLTVVMELSAHMLVHGGLYTQGQMGLAHNDLIRCLASRAPQNKFRQMIEAQGGDPTVVDDPSKLPTVDERNIVPVFAEQDGFAQAIDATQVGRAAMFLGANKEKPEDVIDLAVGLVVNKFVGDAVRKGEPLGWLHMNPDRDKAKNGLAAETFLRAYTIGAVAPAPPGLILASIW